MSLIIHILQPKPKQYSMKVILIIFLLLVSTRAFAPNNPTIYINQSEGINPYKPIIFAIGMVEVFHDGKLDTLSINAKEQAYGYFQVRQVRLDHYYERTGIKYSLQDMLDYEKAEKVFLYFSSIIGYQDPCKIARDWNGSGPMTWIYWENVSKFLII